MIRDDNATWMLGMLEAVAYKMGILIRYESLKDRDNDLDLRSGACRVKGKELIIVDRRLTAKRKCAILATALSRLDLSGVFVPPAVRALIDESKK